MHRTADSENATAPAPNQQIERRIAKRHACDGFAEVIIPSNGFLFRGEIADLSEFGCYIKSRARLNMRRTVASELKFTVNGEHFSVHARVAVVKAGSGVGFEFTQIEPAIHKNLLDMIEELSAREAERTR